MCCEYFLIHFLEEKASEMEVREEVMFGILTPMFAFHMHFKLINCLFGFVHLIYYINFL